MGSITFLHNAHDARRQGPQLVAHSLLRFSGTPTDWRWSVRITRHLQLQRYSRWFFSLAATVLLAGMAQAQERAIQSLDAIRAAAEQAVQAQLPKDQRKYFVTAQRLDERLALARCPQPLDATVSAAQSVLGAHATTAVRCDAAAKWTLYVTVAIQTEVVTMVVKSSLPRDAHVSASDIEMQTRRVNGSAANFLTTVEQLSGRHLKRTVAVGEALTSDVLVPDLLVRRGQQVMLLAAASNFEIRATGKALNDGGISDRVRVQNENSLRVVEGVVESANVVRVTP